MKSIVDEFSDLALQMLADYENTESKFLQFVESSQDIFVSYQNCKQEAHRLQKELIDSRKEVSSLQMKLNNAKELLNMEKNRRLYTEKHKFNLESQISSVMDMLGQGQINETKEKLQTLSNSFSFVSDSRRIDPKELLSPQVCLSTINEHYDSFESVDTASDIDLTGEELEISKTRSGRIFRLSTSVSNPDNLKRKSSGQLPRNKQARCVADIGNIEVEATEDRHKKVLCTPSAPILQEKTNMLTPFLNYNSLKQLTPIQEGRLSHLKSPTMHTPVQNMSRVFPFSVSKSSSRLHNYASKTIYWTDFCQPCGKRIKFGKTAYKCKDCRITCHPDCRENAPLPCIPVSVTPAGKGPQDLISDFAPSVPPMVPAIVVHCTNEIERRGLTEVGLYRVPGAEKDVKDLKERFMKAKGVPNLSQIEIHVIAGALKDFLRSLKEPLVTYALWNKFTDAAENEDNMESMLTIYQVISDLPRANRDTLAWMICHLQRVGESAECKMPIYNLSRVFGPTIIGYSSSQPNPETILTETIPQQNVMKKLLEISSDYWSSYLIPNEQTEDPIQVTSTPEMIRSSLNLRRRSILHKTPLANRFSEVK